MDQDEPIVIVPVFSTRRLNIAGGPPMEQAVPQDYVLASMLLRALESKNGRELEFFIKTFVPFRVHASGKENKYFLTETLGLGLGEIDVLKDIGIDKLLTKVKISNTQNELHQCIDELHSLIDTLSEAEPISVTGFCPAPIAKPISAFFHWPLKSTIDLFSLVLPDVIDVENLKRNESKIVRTSIALIDYLPKLQKIQDLIHGRIIKLLESTEMALSSQRSKLEERVDHLRREVENLESRLVQLKKSDSGDSSRIREIEEQKTARIVALSRDENRLKGLLSTHFESSNELQEKEVVVRQRLSTLRESLCRASDSLGAYMVSGGGLVQEVTSALLMVPFLLVGFSKRGKLSIDVYPPSYLTETPQSVSRRRDFVDAFSVVSDEVLHIADLLRERANTDVNLRKMLRTSSTTHNLLAHPQGRTFLLEGTKALVSDALARESAIDEVKALLSGFPESEITSLPRTFHYAPTSTAAEGLCSVTFHIHDESGTPVSRAVIELGVLRLRSDSKGIVRTSLPRSHYEARVAAPGLQPKNLEFTLRTLDDIVVPVVLVSLSDEERLDQELDALLERASRIEKIREKLRDAFEKQGDTLLTIPAYRAGLEDLLGELGYEPESWISEAKKKKGMVKRLLKKDDRSDGLRRDILQTAEESKQSGGIMLLSELLVRLDNQGWNVNSKEVEVILSEMSEEGLLEGTTALDSGALLVKFIPVSLTDDPQQILSLAAERDGKISIEDAVVGLSWTEERVMNALALLVEKGVAKIQKSYSKSTQYWFPGLRGKK